MRRGVVNEMTPRRQAVLGLVIRSYIERGLPIGSKAFVASYGLDISPATIRNEMAALEELGYLMQPHTSAGRIPTEQGYRYFVHHLLGDHPVLLVDFLGLRLGHVLVRHGTVVLPRRLRSWWERSRHFR